MLSVVVFVWFGSILAAVSRADPLQRLDWIVGTWTGQFQGKVRWPTIPTMTFGETLTVQRAPVAQVTGGVQFYNFTAVSWSHSTKDHLHDEWGYLGVSPNDGKATLMTSGNNGDKQIWLGDNHPIGFNKYEQGFVERGRLSLRLEDIGRVDFTRDLPVHDMRRTFRELSGDYLEQIVEMRTETHPRREGSMLEHSRIIYKKVA